MSERDGAGAGATRKRGALRRKLVRRLDSFGGGVPMPEAIVDVLLAEIAAAGFVIVERGRVERLMTLADLGQEYCYSLSTGEWWCKAEQPHPGDLAPLVLVLGQEGEG